MAARAKRKSGTKPRTSAGSSGRKRPKQKAPRGAAGGGKPARGKDAPLTTPTPMDAIAPIAGTPPTIDGR